MNTIHIHSDLRVNPEPDAPITNAMLSKAFHHLYLLGILTFEQVTEFTTAINRGEAVHCQGTLKLADDILTGERNVFFVGVNSLSTVHPAAFFSASGIAHYQNREPERTEVTNYNKNYSLQLWLADTISMFWSSTPEQFRLVWNTFPLYTIDAHIPADLRTKH